MIGLDANIFIYFLEANKEFGNLTKDIFTSVEQGTIEACASEVTLMEVLAYSGISEASAKKIQQELEKLGVDFKPVTKQVLLEAAKLRRQSNLGALDAIHVASAVLSGCTKFLTNDKKLLTRKVSVIQLLPLATS